MTLGILIMVFSFVAMIGSIITISSFIGYICSKKRKDKLARLESEKMIKVAKCKEELEQCENILKDDTTPSSVVAITKSLKSNLESQLALLTEKK